MPGGGGRSNTNLEISGIDQEGNFEVESPVPEILAAPFIYAQAAVYLVLAVLAVPLNSKLARKYQRQLDELDRSEKEQL